MKIQIEINFPQLRVPRRFVKFQALLLLIILALTVATSRLRADTGTCSGATVILPFNDVMGNAFFCQIAAAYFSGLTNGTSATTYTPSQPVPREQMAAFVSRTLDQSLRRGNRRSALGQWWTPKASLALKPTDISTSANIFRCFESEECRIQWFPTILYTAEFMPRCLPDGGMEFVAADGEYIWVPYRFKFAQVQASRGKIFDDHFTSPVNPRGILIAAGYVWVVGVCTDPTFCPTPESYLMRVDIGIEGHGNGDDNVEISGTNPVNLTFDGEYIWTANYGTGPNTGSITRVSVSLSSNNTFSTGFNQPGGILYDGASLWVTNQGDDSLKRVDTNNGAVLQSIPVGSDPAHLTFDGTNLWVPCFTGNAVLVVRVKDSQGNPLPPPPAANAPAVLAVLFSTVQNGLNGPHTAAFDGERICVTNFYGDSVSLWKAADLTFIRNVSTGFNSRPTGVCSDGINFWIVLQGLNQIVRF